MKEPRRLRDETQSPMERILLDTASSYRRPSSTRAKTLAALGVGGSAALSAGAARGTWAAFAAKLGGAKLLVAVGALGAAVAVPAAYYGLRPARSAPVAVAPSTAPSSEVLSKATAAATQTRPGVEAPSVVAPADAIPRASSALVKTIAHTNMVAADGKRAKTAKTTVAAPAPASTPTSEGHASPELTAEVAALEGARARLARGDANGALALLDEYAAAYPSGNLQPEADVLRIEALAKSGRPVAAKKLAEAFLLRYPKSVLAARVRGHLND